MAVLSRIIYGSSERMDLSDLLSWDSHTAADFQALIKTFVGSDTPYIHKGFDVIQPSDAIGTENISVRVSDSVVYHPQSNAGSFFFGLEEGHEFAQPLVPELRKNATNFVYLSFDTFDTATDSRAFWDTDAGTEGAEFSQSVDTQSVLKVTIGVSTTTFPDGTIPVCKVVLDATSIISIQDNRDMMFRLGSGGVAPNPFSTYDFRALPSAEYKRNEPFHTMSTALDANPFQGGDKNIETMKEWMDVVMTRFKELSGATYWYEAGDGANVEDIFHDTLASTIQSKGEWSHSGVIPGQTTWTEDIHYVYINDPRTVVVRADTVQIPNDSVLYIETIRDTSINTTLTPVSWLAGSNAVTGVVGSFENIKKGDWVKKKSDSHSLYLRVEEFYVGNTIGSGIATPSLARTIKLSDNYGGISGNAIGDYTKGEYTSADINITPRTDAAIHNIAGGLYWIAYRSDTSLALQSITPTTLSLDFSEADGVRVKVSSVGHGLIDNDRIHVSSGAYIGDQKVQVENANVFYIDTAVIATESSIDAYYAIVETSQRTTDDNFVLESANHGFQSSNYITIQNTASSYDGQYQINVRSDTEIQIAIDTISTDPGVLNDEVVVLPRLNVRTEFGTVKVVQGESTNIGDADTANLLDFIGMESLSQTNPNYNTPGGFNALNGYHNFNSEPTDNLTERVSKLTAMMADRVQERGIQFLGRVGITQVSNSLNQDVSATGSITIKKPSSPDQIINLSAAMPANSVAVANIDRDGGTSINLVVESLNNTTLLEENKLILFYRYSDDKIHTWDGSIISPNEIHNLGKPEDSQNRNITMYVPGSIRFAPGPGLITLDMPRGAEETSIQTLAGSLIANSSYFLLQNANNATQFYAWFNVDAGGTDPVIAGRTGIEIAINSADTADQVATAIAGTLDLEADWNGASSGDLATIANVDFGFTTDMEDGLVATNMLFTVLCQGYKPEMTMLVPGSVNDNEFDTDAINLLGTLTIENQQSAWVKVDRYQAKIFNNTQTDPTVVDNAANGSIYITQTDVVPVDQDTFILYSRVDDNLIQHHRSYTPDSNVYDEFISVVAGLPAANEIQGPTPAGTLVVLPADTRDSGTPQDYLVGAGFLEVYLNGQYLTLGDDWFEVGATKCESNKIQLNQTLSVGDRLSFRIDANAGVYFASAGSSSGAGTLQDSYDNGRTITTQPGQPILISGPANEKLAVFQGDIEVTGVIDPKALAFTPIPSNPMVVSDRGLWTNTSDELIFERVSAAPVNLITEMYYRDGRLPMLAAVDMDSFAVVNLPAPTNAGDAVNKNYVDSIFFRHDGGVPLSGTMNAGGNLLVNLSDPSGAQDAATKNYVDTEITALNIADYLKHDGSIALSGDLNLDSNFINNLLDPTNPQDAATKAYVDANAGAAGVYAEYVNGDVATINAGDVVVMGKSLTRTVLLANASSLDLSAGTIGVATEEILVGATGRVQLSGEVVVNTVAGMTLGERAYLSNTSGKVTDVIPSAIGSVVHSLGYAVTANAIVLNTDLRFQNENTYEEVLSVSTTITSGTTLTLPLDTRNLNIQREYIVGSGDLEIHLNGQKLEVGVDWFEVGTNGSISTDITIQQELTSPDKLEFRDTARTMTLLAGGSGGASVLNDLLDVTAPTPSNNDALRYNSTLSRWENVAPTVGDVTGADNVGGGVEVFKAETAGILDFRTLFGGENIEVSTIGDGIQISQIFTKPYFVEYIQGQEATTLVLSADYVPNTNTLDVYRNGVLSMNHWSAGLPVERYMENSRSTVQLDMLAPPAPEDVFTVINQNDEPTYKILLTNKLGIILNVPSYTVGDSSMRIFRNGALMNDAGFGSTDTQYTETSSTVVTLADAATTTDIFTIISGPIPTFREHLIGEIGTVISPITGYTIGTGELLVYKNGILMINTLSLGASIDRYQESSTTTITLEDVAVATDVFTFINK